MRSVASAPVCLLRIEENRLHAVRQNPNLEKCVGMSGAGLNSLCVTPRPALMSGTCPRPQHVGVAATVLWREHAFGTAPTSRLAHFPIAINFVPVRTKRLPCEIATLERWRVSSPASLKFA